VATTKDNYRSFAELERAETQGVDYDIHIKRRNSPVAIIAIHGGQIENGTSEIAKATANGSFNLYLFEGLKPGRPHAELHVTSTLFDDPACVGLVSECDVVVSIHARLDRDDPASVWLGGLDIELRDAISIGLRAAGFATSTGNHIFPADEPNNICNRGRRSMGVQLEAPGTLRANLLDDVERRHVFAQTLRAAIVSRR